MVEKFSPEYHDYTKSVSITNYLGRVATAAVKYATLIGGVYSVCKDERDFAAATLFGIGYVLSDAINNLCKETTNCSRASLLEKRIKGE